MGHAVTPSWPMEANRGVRGRVRAAQKAPEVMTLHRIRPLYDNIHIFSGNCC